MKLQFVALLVMLASSTITSHARGQTMQGYAIAQQSQQGEVQILLLTGTERGAQSASQISIDHAWVLYAVDASPETPWVALAFRTASAYAVSTYNVFTEQFNIVQTDVILPPIPIGLMASPQDIAISPDGHYLAYNVFESDSTIQQNAMVHDITAGNVIHLEDTNGITSQLAWSDDGDRLAVVVTFCTTSCTAALNVYRSNTWSLEKSIDLAAIAEAATFSNSGVCQLAWAPGGQYLSFMANCASVDYGLNKEIYVAEAASGIVSRVTDYTYRQVRTEPLFAVFAEYSTVWLDAHNLMISTHYGSGDGASETFNYNILSEQRTVLSASYSEQLVINASMTEIALSVDASDTSDDVERESGIAIAQVSSQSRNGLALNLSAQAAVIQGCNPEWSPDGNYLVTTSHIDEFCLNSIDGVSFTQISSSTVQLPIVPAQISLPIGWISQP